MADSPFEIPQTMRDLAEQNMKQAHAAYDQLTDFMTKAMGTWMDALPLKMRFRRSRLYISVLLPLAIFNLILVAAIFAAGAAPVHPIGPQVQDVRRAA